MLPICHGGFPRIFSVPFRLCPVPSRFHSVFVPGAAGVFGLRVSCRSCLCGHLLPPRRRCLLPHRIVTGRNSGTHGDTSMGRDTRADRLFRPNHNGKDSNARLFLAKTAQVKR